MTFPALREKETALKAKQDEIAGLFREAGPDMDLTQIKSFKGTSIDKAAHIRKLNDEATALGREADDLRGVQKAADRAKLAEIGGNGESGDGADEHTRNSGGPRAKSIGELFVESPAFLEKKGSTGPSSVLDIHLKTLLVTSAGWAPEVFRTGQVVPFATRPIQVADIIPHVPTTQAAVQYMEETTFTNAAAEVAESLNATPGTYPEAALAFTERLVPVQKLAVFLPVTDEQLDDVPQIQAYLDNRLPFMIRQRLDGQLLAGNGTPPNLKGITQVAGIQTQAKGTDPGPDAIYKAIVKVEVTGQAFANAVLMHPNDWQNIRLLRTADGIYIWGNPADTGPERVWGLQVVRAQAASAGTAIVGDFANFSQLAVRKGIEVQVSNSHSTYFVEGKQAIRADMRCAFVVFRPAAFCTVTGL